jgi:hypothetical protein
MAASPGEADTSIPRDGSEAFHRRHELRAIDERTVLAAIEDDMHHFELTLRHDGHVVTAVEGRAVRWPWAPCVEGARVIDALVGLPLSPSSSAVGTWTDASGQCTHQFDLAGLAVAHAARHAAGGAASRSYLAVVPDWHEHPFDAWILRDGVEVLRFTVGSRALEAPEAFAGVALNQRFIQWCASHLDDDTTEAALLLRRAAWMSPARHIDLEAFAMIADSMVKTGVCYATQPERLEIGRRNRHSLRDFGTHPQDLLADFPAPPPVL